MNIPQFPECNHALIRSLNHYSDQELLTLFQRHADAGQYFTAIFCRYSPLVYTLIRHSARSPVQADYLFAITWRHIFHELRGLDIHGAAPFNLQNWLINVTAVCINTANLPAVESIHYSLSQASPPLWIYLGQALEQIQPLHRLVVLMAQTFNWSATRIAAYLQAEGERITALGVRERLAAAYQELEEALPADIRAIYLDGPLSGRMATAHDELDPVLDF